MGHKDRLRNFLLTFLPRNAPSYAEMCDTTYDKLVASVLCNNEILYAMPAFSIYQKEFIFTPSIY